MCKLKAKLNEIKRPKETADYKKQRNLAVKSNKDTKIEYFENLETSKNSLTFRNKCKPYFPYKHADGISKIILTEIEKVAANRGVL